jgi:3D (Asp-Asp-Asp) domain-containing protein
MQKNVSILFVLLLIFSCDLGDSKSYVWHTKEVTATAYNSLAYQTNEQPNITAFGDTLTPGMKCIAVSRDLLKLGLKHNTLVTIEGFDGVFLVKDKMHTRWKNRIDIYMGNDVNAAKEWGRKKLKIKYRLEVKDSI